MRPRKQVHVRLRRGFPGAHHPVVVGHLSCGLTRLAWCSRVALELLTLSATQVPRQRIRGEANGFSIGANPHAGTMQSREHGLHRIDEAGMAGVDQLGRPLLAIQRRCPHQHRRPDDPHITSTRSCAQTRREPRNDRPLRDLRFPHPSGPQATDTAADCSWSGAAATAQSVSDRDRGSAGLPCHGRADARGSRSRSRSRARARVTRCRDCARGCAAARSSKSFPFARVAGPTC